PGREAPEGAEKDGLAFVLLAGARFRGEPRALALRSEVGLDPCDAFVGRHDPGGPLHLGWYEITGGHVGGGSDRHVLPLDPVALPPCMGDVFPVGECPGAVALHLEHVAVEGPAELAAASG